MTCHSIVLLRGGYCSERGHLLKPAIGNRRALQASSPFYRSRCFFSSLPWCPVHRPQDELTRIKMWKKGRSQRILPRTCREIVYSVVLWPKRAKKKWIVYCSHIWRFLPILMPVMHVVCIVVYTWVAPVVMDFLSTETLNVKLRKMTVVSKWKHTDTFRVSVFCRRKKRVFRRFAIQKDVRWANFICLERNPLYITKGGSLVLPRKVDPVPERGRSHLRACVKSDL